MTEQEKPKFPAWTKLADLPDDIRRDLCQPMHAIGAPHDVEKLSLAEALLWAQASFDDFDRRANTSFDDWLRRQQ